MGRLVKFNQLEPDPSWFFSTANYDHNLRQPWSNQTGGWRCDLEEDPASAIRLYIHWDTLDPSCEYLATNRRIEIRKWIEHNLDETVILTSKNLEYRYYYHSPSKKYSYQYHLHDKAHGYHVFIFESEAAAIQFKLRFGDIASTEISLLHQNHLGSGTLRASLSPAAKALFPEFSECSLVDGMFNHHEI